MDALTVGLLVVVLLLAFKDKLGAWAGKLRYRLQAGSSKQLAEYHHNRVMTQLSQFGSEYKMQAGELNHIKGQLQETLHRISNNEELIIRQASVDIAPVQKEIEEVKSLVQKLLGADAQAQAVLYSQALGSLAKGQEVIIDALEQVKNNQVQVVNALNRLTTG